MTSGFLFARGVRIPRWLAESWRSIRRARGPVHRPSPRPASRQPCNPVLGDRPDAEITPRAGIESRMKDLVPIAEKIAARLIERKQTIAVAESSTGGLISASLLAVPGASAYFLGGGVIYTRDARRILMDIPDDAMKGIRSASEPYAKLLASQIRARFATDWGLSETGATRSHRQPLRRRRRPQLHGARRAGECGDHAGDGKRGPARQHAQFCKRGAESVAAEFVAVATSIVIPANAATPYAVTIGRRTLSSALRATTDIDALWVPAVAGDDKRSCALTAPGTSASAGR